MCLDYDKAETKRIEGLLGKSSSKTKIFYKVYEISTWKNQFGKGIMLKTLYYGRDPISKPGYVVSNRGSKEITYSEKDWGKVYAGIHVHETNQSTKCDIDCATGFYRTTVVIPVVCALKDLVASGYYNDKDSSVFMKIKITKKTWKKLEKQFLKK